MSVRRAVIVLGGVIAALFLLGYGASYALYGDEVPRGVHVGGVDLSGRSEAEAQSILSRELADEAGAPMELVADDVRMTFLPLLAGLRVDVPATVEEARSGGPLDRLRGLLGTRRD